MIRSPSGEEWSLKARAKPKTKIMDSWPGKNRFYCSGKCISGPWGDLGAQYCVFCSISIAIGVYYGLMASTLSTKVTGSIRVVHISNEGGQETTEEEAYVNLVVCEM